MAEQRVSNERRKELAQLDPFQEKLLKLMACVKEYKKQLILIAGAIVLVTVIFSGIMYSFQKSENEAATLVNQALKKYAQLNDPDKGYLETKDDFQVIFSDFSNTAAGKLARVRFAKICFDASEFDQSYQYYEDGLEIFENDAFMENFLLASLGNVCIARKDFQGAKKYFSRIETGDSDLLKDEARFALAMLDEAADNISASKTMYEKIVENHGNSIYKPIAKSKINKM